MPFSMTGYGQGVGEQGGVVLRVEIRSVNHRFLETRLHLPPPLFHLEPTLLSRIQKTLQRGRIELTVRIDNSSCALTAVRADLEMAQSYLGALKQLSAECSLPEMVDVATLAGFEGVLLSDLPSGVAQTAVQAAQQALQSALDELVQMRAVEGARLEQDISSHLAMMAQVTDQIGELLPRVAQRARERLQARVGDLLQSAGLDVSLDEPRLLTEVALIAERSDVSEEMVRLRSHLKAMESLLRQSGPVGRKADFLCQELLREVNTLGSKAADIEVTNLVVELKAELERIREQVQNLE